MATKKSKPWSESKYKEALRGSDGMPGLRSIVKGFNATDGYDLRHELTKSQKARIRKYYAEVSLLEAQPRRIFRTKNKAHLELAQLQNHGKIQRQYKVALIHNVEPVTMPGEPAPAHRLRFNKGVIWDDFGGYAKASTSFNQVALARDPVAEINRALDVLGGAAFFYVQVGEFRTLSGEGREDFIEQVMMWMHQYDGIKQLPKTSGNIGDAPAWHRYDKWLNGVIGIKYPGPKNRDDTSIMESNIRAGLGQYKARRASHKSGQGKYSSKSDAALLKSIKSSATNKKYKPAMKRELTQRGVDWRNKT